jgi:hypothetical protein
MVHVLRARAPRAHFTFPLVPWSSRSRRRPAACMELLAPAEADLGSPTSQSSWLTHEGSFHVSLRIMMSLDDLRTHVAETIMSNCCLVFVRQWWRLCHASRSSTAQWQWPCSYHHDTIMRLARSVVGIGRPLYVHLIIIQSAILRQSHHHESDKLIAWIICVLRVPLLSAVCNCRHTKFHSVGIFSLII